MAGKAMKGKDDHRMAPPHVAKVKPPMIGKMMKPKPMGKK